jgi:calcineurin-like phosphoesterase family protein
MNYFTSDLHVNHANILAYSHRPFSSVPEMNEALIVNFNKRVKAEDTVYIIGDFMMGHGFKENLLAFTPRLNGKKVLVKGNHDRSSELYLAAGFAEVHNQVVLPISGSTYPSVLLQHKPPQKAVGTFPYAYVLHGHVHELFKTRAYWVNVGVDVQNYEPKTLEELVDGVVPNSNAIGQDCINCGMPTTERDGICSQACLSLMWEDDYDKSRSGRKFR